LNVGEVAALLDAILPRYPNLRRGEFSPGGECVPVRPAVSEFTIDELARRLSLRLTTADSEGSMKKLSEERQSITDPFIHDLVNKLAVIVGHCDLLSEHLKEGSQCAKRVGTIQEIAREMGKELKEYQCLLSESARRAGIEEPDVA